MQSIKIIYFGDVEAVVESEAFAEFGAFVASEAVDSSHEGLESHHRNSRFYHILKNKTKHRKNQILEVLRRFKVFKIKLTAILSAKGSKGSDSFSSEKNQIEQNMQET